jgi:hypothetical protein
VSHPMGALYGGIVTHINITLLKTVLRHGFIKKYFTFGSKLSIYIVDYDIVVII